MSKRSIDERVVQLSFDNKQFEAGVAQSNKTLEQLNKNLEFKNVDKSFSKLSKAMSGISGSIGRTLDDLANTASNFGSRFISAFNFVSFARMADGIINKISQITRELTVTPVFQGFNEYELKMGSIQTIMASTGESLETVNKYLEDLNEYADKTIYSFSDMTTNVGKFTNAGIDLDMVVGAIKGISNEAALAGANTQEASHAMYNFAQALSSGAVRLTDWKSIQTANMDTKEFKEQLLETALAIGTVVKVGEQYKSTTTDMNGRVSDLFDSTVRFNESLSSQWLTTDVLIQTLNKYADETTEIGRKAFRASQDVKTMTQLLGTLSEAVGSGWAKSFEIMIGNLDEAREMFTNVNIALGGMVDASSDSRNKILSDWKEFGGRAYIISGISNTFKNLVNILNSVKKAFRDIFPRKTGQQLANLSLRFTGFTRNIMLNEETLDKLTRTFKGLFAAVDIVKTIFGGPLVSLIRSFLRVITSATGGVLDFTAGIGDGIVVLRNWINEHLHLNKIFDGFATKIVNGISYIRKWISEFLKLPIVTKSIEGIRKAFDAFVTDLETYFGDAWQAIKEWFERVKNLEGGFTLENIKASLSDFKNNVLSTFGDISGKFGTFGTSFSNFIADIKNGTSSLMDSAGPAFQEFANVFSGFFNTLKESLKTTTFGDIIGILFGAGAIATLINITSAIKIVVTTLSDYTNIFTNLVKSVTGTFNQLIKTFKNVGTWFNTAAIFNIAASIGVLAASLWVISKIPAENLEASAMILAGLAIAIIGMAEAAARLPDPAKVVGLFSSLGTAVLLLASALKIVASIDINDLKEPFQALVVLLAEFFVGIIAVSKFSGDAKVGTGQILAVSIGVFILVKALQEIAEMPMSSIVKGLVGVTGAILVMILAVKGMTRKVIEYGSRDFKKSKYNASIGSIIGAVVALLAMTAVIKKLGEIPTEKLVLGFINFVPVFNAMIATFAAARLAGKNAGKAGVEMVGIAIAVAILTSIMKKIALFSPETIAKGVGGITALIVGLSIAMRSTKNAGGNSAKAGVYLLSMSAAVAILAAVAVVIGQIDKNKIIKGVAAVDALILGVAAATAATGKAGTEDQRKTVIALAVIVAILAVAIGILANLNTAGVIASAASLSAVMLSLAGSLSIISKSKIDNGIIKKVALMSIIVGALGGFIGLLSQMTDPLSAIGAATAIGLLINALATAMLILSKSNISADAVGQLMIMSVIITAMAGLFAAIAMIPANIEVLVALVGGMSGLIIALATAVHILDAVNVEPKAVVSLTIMAAVVTAMGALFALISNIPANFEALIPLMKILGASIFEMSAALAVLSLVKASPTAALGFLAMVGVVVLIIAALVGISYIPHIDEFVERGGELFKKLGELIGEFVGSIVAGFGTAVTSALPGIADNLSKFAAKLVPFIVTIKMIDGKAIDAALSLVAVIAALTAASFLDGIMSFLGGGVDFGKFGDELAKLAPGIITFCTSIKDLDNGLLAKASLAGKIVASFADAIPRSGGIVQDIMGEIELGKFGEELASFGDNLAVYAECIKPIENWDQIDKSAASATLVAEFADKVPNTGGHLANLVGDNGLAKFGAELQAFGRNFAAYYREIEPIKDWGLVKKSAESATLVAEFANKVPNTGGVLAGLMGDNGIAKFGAELQAFGRNFKGYYNNVAKITDWSIVDYSIDIAGMIAAFADTIPNDGGVWGFLTGNNGLGTFGAELEKFGKSFVKYAEYVEGITNFKTVSDSIAVIGDLTSYVGNVDQGTGGLWGLLTGDLSTMDHFRDNFADLGYALSEFHTNVKDITISNMSGIFGYLNGLSTTMSELTDADTWATGLKEAFIDVMNVSIATVDSFTDDFKQAGKSLAINLVNGIAVALVLPSQFLSRNMTILANRIITGMKDRLGIESPSKVMRDEVGIWIVKGIAEGITKDMSAEEAAKKKAENIVSAFQEVIDKFELNISTIDLEFELWSLLHPDATDKDKAWAELGMYENKIKKQQELVGLAQREYEITLAELGADADETKEAYNKWLKAQIELAKLQNDYEEAQKRHAETTGSTLEQQYEAQKAAFEKYREFYQNAYHQYVEVQGMSEDEFKKLAQEFSGYDPDLYQKLWHQIIFGAEDVSKGVGEAAASAAQNATLAAANKAAEEVTEAVENASIAAAIAAQKVSDIGSSTLENSSQSWYDSASLVVGKFTEGLIKGFETVKNGTIELLKMVVDYFVEDPDEVLANHIGRIVFKINDLILSGLDTAPVIRPVLDMTDIEAGIHTMNGMFRGFNVGFNAGQTKIVSQSSDNSNEKTENGATEAVSKTYNFTQNNYSPKALSRLEIYRQTKNQFSALKGRT